MAIELSTQINKEHELVLTHAVKALEHARKAGELLIQAKADCKHGEWGEWLDSNFHGSSRQAQRYMKVHQRWPEIEAKATRGSDFSLREGLKLLEAKKEPGDDLWVWADQHLNGPFTAWDFEDTDIRWLATKLLRTAGAPAITSLLITMGLEYGLALERLCPYDEIDECFAAVAPFAKGEGEIPFDTSGMGLLKATNRMVSISIISQMICGILLNEFDYRRQVDQEQYEHDWEETHSQLKEALDSKLKDLAA